jgi:hypothetical protein
MEEPETQLRYVTIRKLLIEEKAKMSIKRLLGGTLPKQVDWRNTRKIIGAKEMTRRGLGTTESDYQY